MQSVFFSGSGGGGADDAAEVGEEVDAPGMGAPAAGSLLGVETDGAPMDSLETASAVTSSSAVMIGVGGGTLAAGALSEGFAAADGVGGRGGGTVEPPWVA